MTASGFQLRIGTLLGLVACVAVNIWLFRVGTLLGLFGLNVTRHVVVAYVCQVTGINRPAEGAGPSGPPPPHLRQGGA